MIDVECLIKRRCTIFTQGYFLYSIHIKIVHLFFGSFGLNTYETQQNQIVSFKMLYHFDER